MLPCYTLRGNKANYYWIKDLPPRSTGNCLRCSWTFLTAPRSLGPECIRAQQHCKLSPNIRFLVMDVHFIWTLPFLSSGWWSHDRRSQLRNCARLAAADEVIIVEVIYSAIGRISQFYSGQIRLISPSYKISRACIRKRSGRIATASGEAVIHSVPSHCFVLLNSMDSFCTISFDSLKIVSKQNELQADWVLLNFTQPSQAVDIHPA